MYLPTEKRIFSNLAAEKRKLTKDFDFDYGHRVWSQDVKREYAGKDGDKCVCRHIHGHRGHVRVTLSSKELVDGMVTDLKHLGWLKDLINQHVDHKFILDRKDPAFETFIPKYGMVPCENCSTVTIGMYCHNCGTKRSVIKELELEPVYIDDSNNYLIGYRATNASLEPIAHLCQSELLNGYLVVDFVPTSENLSEWIANIVHAKMKSLCNIHGVIWFETPKSSAEFIAEEQYSGLVPVPASNRIAPLNRSVAASNRMDKHSTNTMCISDVIRSRLEQAGANYYANDNISEYIQPEELSMLKEEVASIWRLLLRSLIISDKDQNIHKTFERMAKMYISEIFAGRYYPMPKIAEFPNISDLPGISHGEIYLTGPITTRSTCAHHLQAIVGTTWIGVIPGSTVIGLSKYNRLVEWCATRMQIQEELTKQITHVIMRETRARGVIVVLKASHMCLTHRGAKEHGSDMTTVGSAGVFGIVHDDVIKQENDAVKKKELIKSNKAARIKRSDFLSLLPGMYGYVKHRL